MPLPHRSLQCCGKAGYMQAVKDLEEAIYADEAV